MLDVNRSSLSFTWNQGVPVKLFEGKKRLVDTPESPVVVCIEQDEHVATEVQEIDVGQGVLEVCLFSRSELSVRQLLRQATEVKPDELGPLVVAQELLDGSELLAISVRVVLLNPPPE